MSKLNKPVCIIGYPESTYTCAFVDLLSSANIRTTVLLPEEYFALTDKAIYQYLIGFTLDRGERIRVIQDLDSLGLECFTFVHRDAQVSKTNVSVGKGTVIWHSTSIHHNTRIGDHCVVGPKSFISHEVEIGNNVLMWPDVSIGGRVKIGNDCKFNMKTAVLDKINICDGVEVGALSNITKSISESGLYCGHIARRVKSG